MKNKFIERLEQGALLFDGGMGTELYNRGVFINKCFEELNLTNPDLILQVHEDYIKAGADVIETNTFAAGKIKLKHHQLEDKLYEINRKGAEIAVKAAKSNAFVAGAIGPLGLLIEPLGPTSYSEAEDYFKEQIIALKDGGVDLFICETFVYIDELKIAIQAIRKYSDLPVIAQITIDEDLTSLTGANPEEVVLLLESLGADAIGINCTVGPQIMLNWLERVRKITNRKISIMPNAGKPKNIDGRNIYLTSPEYLGEYAKHFIHAGADIIGGCCGTGPEHIKRMRNMLDSIKPDLKKKQFVLKESVTTIETKEVHREQKSKLSRRLSDGKFVTLAELLSPHGSLANKEIEKAKELYFFGVDAINIPDGPRASARMSALSLAVQIQQKVGIETVLHYVCRDRNVIGIQSDLLGAYSLGLKNILAITGDPPKLGNYPDATAVFDVDSIGLVNIINRLNNGLDIAGNKIANGSNLFAGVGANPGAVNLDEEIRRLDWKVDAGAEYVITQPIFDLDIFYKFLKRIEHIKIPIIAGIWPLTSIRNAEFMNNEIPGCNVPDYILGRLKRLADDKEASLNEGILIAKEILATLRNDIQGVQVSAPFGRVESVVAVLESYI